MFIHVLPFLAIVTSIGSFSLSSNISSLPVGPKNLVVAQVAA